jgi:orotate phosphoribosyltransferase
MTTRHARDTITALFPKTLECPDVSKFRELLQPLVQSALIHQETVLSSGQTSSFYFDGRLVTLSAEGAFYLARHLLETIPADSYDAIGGMATGADPISAAVSAISFELGCPKTAFIVRKEAKGHGRMKRIEGPLESGSRVIIVDDVATSGGSIIDAAHAVEEERGCKVVRVVALVDRQQGAAELFEEAGYEFTPVFTAQELGVSLEDILAEKARATAL